ncbi:adenylate/guanylate cyclase domain-containing protein [Nitrosopumilus sp.]|uniref:adenylate/guanylate cyclase domain-containing protein n=1 Tax=Nitrosopumilus sp. TaxID=2024843 RepID=UPI003B5B7771
MVIKKFNNSQNEDEYVHVCEHDKKGLITDESRGEIICGPCGQVLSDGISSSHPSSTYALENGYQYTRVIDSSEKFLRKNVFGQINMGVLYVDIVGSTKMSITLPPDKLSIIISSFSQEMSYVIEQFHGYVLKFVGDAVIGYFVEDETDKIPAAYETVACAESMVNVVKQGINPILIEKMGLSEISIKIGIDFGSNVGPVRC